VQGCTHLAWADELCRFLRLKLLRVKVQPVRLWMGGTSHGTSPPHIFLDAHLGSMIMPTDVSAFALAGGGAATIRAIASVSCLG